MRALESQAVFYDIPAQLAHHHAGAAAWNGYFILPWVISALLTPSLTIVTQYHINKTILKALSKVIPTN